MLSTAKGPWKSISFLQKLVDSVCKLGNGSPALHVYPWKPYMYLNDIILPEWDSRNMIDMFGLEYKGFIRLLMSGYNEC